MKPEGQRISSGLAAVSVIWGCCWKRWRWPTEQEGSKTSLMAAGAAAEKGLCGGAGVRPDYETLVTVETRPTAAAQFV